MPGVASASLTTHTPLSGALWSEPAVPAGQPIPDRDTALFVGAGPQFLETMQIPLIAGRGFTGRTLGNRQASRCVNERYAQRHFPGRMPIGQRLDAIVRGERRELEIVGLVRNVRAANLRAEPPATVYVPYAQLTGNLPTTIAVRVDSPTARMQQAVKDAVRPHLPGMTPEIRTFSTQVEGTLVQERVMASLAAAFGVLALTLACVGLYGLLAYNVAQRTKEIGIRIALGAQAPRVVSLVLGRATRLVVVGLAAGLPAAWMASRWIESMLFGLTPNDPAALGSAIAVLLIAAQLAAYLPARRASRVDPLTALRHE